MVAIQQQTRVSSSRAYYETVRYCFQSVPHRWRRPISSKFGMFWTSLILISLACCFWFHGFLEGMVADKGPSIEDPSLLEWNFPVFGADGTLTGNRAQDATQRRAIFLLSMGRDASQATIVERCLLSIRRIGQYLGPVVVLTDASSRRYRSLINMDPMLFVMQPIETDWRRELHEDMPYKRFKTYALEYLKRDHRLDPVQLVYYFDIDVTVGRPLQPWFDHVEKTYFPLQTASTDPTSPGRNQSHMVFFEGNSKRRPLQGGQFVIDRSASQACLERWRYHIDAHPDDPKDQSALTLIYQELHNATAPCHLTIMPQAPHLRFLDREGMNELIQYPPMFPFYTATKRKDYPTLLHIKNTEDADWIPNRVQRRFFQQVLRLSNEEAEVVGKTQIHPSVGREKNS